MQFSAVFLSLLALAAAIPVDNKVPTTKAEMDALAKYTLDQIRAGGSRFQAMETVAKAFNYDDDKAQGMLDSLHEQGQNMKRDAEFNLLKREKWYEYFYCFGCGWGDYGCSSTCSPP